MEGALGPAHTDENGIKLTSSAGQETSPFDTSQGKPLSTLGDGRGRDLAIDTVRGICIVMMIASHIAAASILDRVTHPSGWVDGASGFVLMSGLLVGLVQRRLRERSGERAGAMKLLKRIGIVYAGHVWLCLAAFFAVAINSTRGDTLPAVENQGGVIGAFVRTLTLQINPYYASILSMYVVLMIVALGSIWVLRRGRLDVVILLTFVSVVFGILYPSMSALPREYGEPGPITLATWHGLFTIGLVTGWYWQHPKIRALFKSRGFLITAAIVAISGIIIPGYMKLTHIVPPSWMDVAFSKDQMGPGRIVASVLTFYFIYRILTSLLGYKSARTVLTPLTFLGTRSLDSYIILSTLVLVLPAVWEWRSDSATAMILALFVAFICLGWGLIRARSSTPILGSATSSARRQMRSTSSV